jgi:hypothetical protein
MFSYNAFGLNISSELELPELVSTAFGPYDVTIRLGRIEEFEPNLAGRNHSACADKICFNYPDVGRIAVRGGVEIVVDPAPGAYKSLVRVCLLGPGLAALLHQRGLLILHGSAVTISGTAVAFLGDKGWGKSTLAAYLQSRGHSFLADDIVALQLESTGRIRIIPGFPHLKLWPDSASYFGMDLDGMTRLQPGLDKRGHRLDDDFSTAALELGAIYILDIGDEDEVVPIGRSAALMELVRHSYLAGYLDATGTAGYHLQQCGRVVSSVPVSYLKRLPSLFRLPEIERLLEENVLCAEVLAR